MMALNLTVGRWNLSFELGRQAEPEEPSASITLSDGSEVADDPDSDIEAGFGFGPVIVGEKGPELYDFPDGGTIARPEDLR